MYSLSEREYLTLFGAKTSLTKAERTYLGNIKKQDLINEASKLGLMVDEKLTKDKIFNVIKKYKQQLNAERIKREKQEERQRTMYEMSGLLNALQSVSEKPVGPVVPINDFSNIRVSKLFDSEAPRYRWPRGGKIDKRKIEGYTLSEIRKDNKEFLERVDDLSDLFEKTSIDKLQKKKRRETQPYYLHPHSRQNYGLYPSKMYFR